MTLENLIALTGAKNMTPGLPLDTQVSCGYTCDLLSWGHGTRQAGHGLDHRADAHERHRRGLPDGNGGGYYSRGYPDGGTLLEKAREEGVAVLQSDKTAFALCALLAQHGLPSSQPGD